MDESREYEAFEKLLSGDSGFTTDEMANLASLARALEANAPARPVMRSEFRGALRRTLVLEPPLAPVIPLGARVRASWQARNVRMQRSFRMVATVAAAAVIMAVGGSLMAIASTAQPGSALYGLKIAKEDLSVALALGNINHADRQLDLARERVSEMRVLAARGETDPRLYVNALLDMDARTVDASTRFLNEFRKNNDNDTLAPLIAFAAAQRQDLEHLTDSIPPAARPKANGSLELLTTVQGRVSNVLGGCECPTNPLETITSGSSGTNSAVACTCTKKATSGSSSTASVGPRHTSNPPSKTKPPTNDGKTHEDPPPVDPITALDHQVTDTVNQTLENLGLSPSPLPSIPPLLP